MKTTILLADDHRIMREGLRSMLESESDFEIVGEAENGRDAVRMVLEQMPDVVVMDVGMPHVNGVEATQLIRKRCDGVRIVALSMHSDRQFVTGMLEAGASGYVLKSEALEELVEAIRAVQADRIYTSPRVTNVVVKLYVRTLTEPRRQPAANLSPRECEVLCLIAEGRSTREIAGRLHVTGNTIDTHRRRIMEKLDLHSVAELTKYAIREGLTSIDD